VDCTLEHYLIEGYLDGELGFERTLEVEAHLASCSGCAQEVQSWKSVREALQKPDLYFRAGPELERKIRKGLPAPTALRDRAPWFSRWLWAGSGAALATAALLVAFFVSRPSSVSSDQELVTSHVRSLMSNHLMDVVSTDQHTVKPWFDGKLDFAPPVRDLADQGYPLAGGRLDFINGRTVAALVYHRALHPINLYIWPAGSGGEGSWRTETIRGYNVISIRKNGFEFRGVSDLNTEELRDFMQRVTQ
jgi:anti-sigma factor RsiW